MSDILIVDDIASWRDSCNAIFSIAGYSCDFATSVEEAKIKLDTIGYRLVCVNLKIIDDQNGEPHRTKPDYRNGRALLQRLGTRFPQIPVLVVTGYYGGPPHIIDEKVTNLKKGNPNIREVLLKGDPEAIGEEFIDALLQAASHAITERVIVREYTDFELVVNTDGSIRARSDEGVKHSRITVDIPSEIASAMEEIECGYADETRLRDIGKTLYEMLFPDAIHTHLHQTEGAARSRGLKLRIRLTITPDQLARIPWELMYRVDGGYYLAQNPGTALSRYLDVPLPEERLRDPNSPLHMLVIVSSPDDQAPLTPDVWEHSIRKALSVTTVNEAILLSVVKHATYEEIRDALSQAKPDIVQFVGYGVFRDGKGVLALVDSKTNATWWVESQTFADILFGHDDHLRLVSLASCESATSTSYQAFLGVAPKLVQRGIPAVIAMNSSVSVSTAEIFLESFFRDIVAHMPIDWAVQQARNAVSIKRGLDNSEFAAPVLFMRSRDGIVF